jgi:hypothetical protein
MKEQVKNLPIDEPSKKRGYPYNPKIARLGSCTIAEALDDWDKAYEFSISAGQIDYGHIFPAREIRNFVKK